MSPVLVHPCSPLSKSTIAPDFVPRSSSAARTPSAARPSSQASAVGVSFVSLQRGTLVPPAPADEAEADATSERLPSGPTMRTSGAPEDPAAQTIGSAATADGRAPSATAAAARDPARARAGADDRITDPP